MADVQELPYRSHDQRDEELNDDDYVEYERIRQSGRERLLQLAQPKEPKTEWYTSIGPHLMWGTQEMIWPIKNATKSADASERIRVLATPKRNFFKERIRPEFYYSCGRSSVIWDVEARARTGDTRERTTTLAQPKPLHSDYKPAIRQLTMTRSRTDPSIPQYTYSCGRKSPIWEVNSKTRTIKTPAAMEFLAQQKKGDSLSKPDKPIQTIIPPQALKTEPTERLITLSNPKSRSDSCFRSPQWDVTENAKNAQATSRCNELSRAKTLAEGYQLPREVEWPVSRAARRANSSARLEELAKPLVRASMDHVQFNPDAFMVKPLALTGTYPARIDKLARPVDR